MGGVRANLWQWQQKLAVALDRYIPVEATAVGLNPTRDRVLVGYILLQTTILPAAALALLLQPSVRPAIRWQAALALVALAMIYRGWLWGFSYGMPRQFTVHGSVAFAYLTVVGGIVASGGIDASAIPLLLIVLPALGFCLGGERTGIAWTIVVIATLGALRQLGPTPRWQTMDFTGSDMARIGNIVWGISLLTLGGILVVYEQMYRWYSSRLNTEREMYYQQAHHDKLTGLANRRRFEQVIEGCLEEAMMRRRLAALIYVDLDDFKPVNDELGHDVGDWVLRQVARRIIKCLRQSDIAARLGGDEFGIVISPLENAAQAEALVVRLEHELSKPLVYQDHHLQVGASVGFSIYPDDGRDRYSLARHADAMMYGAKRRRKTVAVAAHRRAS